MNQNGTQQKIRIQLNLRGETSMQMLKGGKTLNQILMMTIYQNCILRISFFVQKEMLNLLMSIILLEYHRIIAQLIKKYHHMIYSIKIVIIYLKILLNNDRCHFGSIVQSRKTIVKRQIKWEKILLKFWQTHWSKLSLSIHVGYSLLL